jgi:hypothetical protein
LLGLRQLRISQCGFWKPSTGAPRGEAARPPEPSAAA